jgi:exopolysaccharide biosynthesis protein
MKQYYLTILYITLFSLSAVVVCAGEQLAPGITYSHITRTEPKLISVHMIEIAPNTAIFDLTHAQGGGLSREPISSIGKRMDALIALNMGNYRRGGQFNGNAVGFLKIHNVLYADPHINRALVSIADDTHLVIEQVPATWQLTIGEQGYTVDRINQPRGPGENIIYTPPFGTTTLTAETGLEIVVANNQVIAINRGNSVIPDNGFVYSVAQCADIQSIQIGMPVQLVHRMSSERQCAVSGAGLLIKNGKIVDNFHADFSDDAPIVHTGDEVAADFYDDQERTWLIELSHPRTALGIKADNSVVILVVDGRQPQLSEGMTFAECARFLLECGCVQAINLGGGGCTTLYIKNKGVVNSPANTYDAKKKNSAQCNERPVSDALVIYAY